MKKAVLFDFDGVLVNTSLIWYEIHKENNPNLDFLSFQKMSNGNFIDESKKAEKSGFVLSPNNNEKYQNILSKTDIEKSIIEVIKNISNKYKLFIVSSGSESIIKEYLNQQNALLFFSGIFGHETHTSKEEKIKNISKNYQIELENTVMITDTAGDIYEAKKAGVKTIGVLWGVHDLEMLSESGTDKIVDIPSDLQNVIEELL